MYKMETYSQTETNYDANILSDMNLLFDNDDEIVIFDINWFKDNDIHDIVYSLKSLLHLVDDAIDNFIHRKMELFDPILGDQACEIRALYFSLLISKYQTYIENYFENDVDNLKKTIYPLYKKMMEIEFISENYTENRNEFIKKEIDPIKKEKALLASEFKNINAELRKSKNDNSLELINKKKEIEKKIKHFDQLKKISEEVLHENHKKLRNKIIDTIDLLVFPIKKILFMIISSYIFSKVKHIENVIDKTTGLWTINDRTHINLLKFEEMNFHSDIMQNIITLIKEKLIHESVIFSQKLTKFLKSKNKDLILKIIMEPRRVSAHREEFACFHIMWLIHRYALENDIPIILKIRNETLDPLKSISYTAKFLYLGNKRYSIKKDNFQFNTMIAPMYEAGLIIEARTNRSKNELTSKLYEEEILSYSLLDIIKLYSAQHRQFTNDTKHEDALNNLKNISEFEKEKIKKLKNKARLRGFSITNSSRFCIEHIYCDMIKNHL